MNDEVFGPVKPGMRVAGRTTTHILCRQVPRTLTWESICRGMQFLGSTEVLKAAAKAARNPSTPLCKTCASAMHKLKQVQRYNANNDDPA